MFRQLEGTDYSPIARTRIDVKLRNEFVPYLYPNTYCEYDAASECVRIAKDICVPAKTDIERYDKIYWWIVDNVEYDTELAKRVQTDTFWLPDPNDVIATGKSICWGYASLLAAMCRSQGIPCRICVGRVTGALHAWNEIWLEHGGTVHGIVYKPGAFVRTDITFMDASGGSLAEWVMDDVNFPEVEYYG